VFRENEGRGAEFDEEGNGETEEDWEEEEDEEDEEEEEEEEEEGDGDECAEDGIIGFKDKKYSCVDSNCGAHSGLSFVNMMKVAGI
jgi:hypothetical protein